MGWFARVTLIAAVVCGSGSAEADDPGWMNRWDGSIYSYGSDTEVRDDSVLNPANRMARLPEQSAVAETRLNIRTERGHLRLTLRPIIQARHDRNQLGYDRRKEAYLSQGQVRLRLAPAWHVSAGRELINWGPAQFRSPSSPFYFDNGRSDPLRELSGVDGMKWAWTPDIHRTVYLAWVADAGHRARDDAAWRNTWLVRAEQRGSDWAGGLVLAKQSGRAAFIGAHWQQAASDALLFYAEAGSYTRTNALISPRDTAQPFGLMAESSRRTDLLFGAAYTLDNGQTLSTEYLHYGHGMSGGEERAYFDRAAAAANTFYTPAAQQTLGLALGYAPPLLGKDYLHLVWQSNLVGSAGYWRLMFTHGFTDSSQQAAGYAEVTLNSHLTGFTLGVLPIGGAQREFSSLINRRVMAGIKLALP